MSKFFMFLAIATPLVFLAPLPLAFLCSAVTGNGSECAPLLYLSAASIPNLVVVGLPLVLLFVFLSRRARKKEQGPMAPR